jgi:hypothetical protein
VLAGVAESVSYRLIWSFAIRHAEPCWTKPIDFYRSGRRSGRSGVGHWDGTTRVSRVHSHNTGVRLAKLLNLEPGRAAATGQRRSELLLLERPQHRGPRAPIRGQPTSLPPPAVDLCPRRVIGYVRSSPASTTDSRVVLAIRGPGSRARSIRQRRQRLWQDRTRCRLFDEVPELDVGGCDTDSRAHEGPAAAPARAPCRGSAESAFDDGPFPTKRRRRSHSWAIASLRSMPYVREIVGIPDACRRASLPLWQSARGAAPDGHEEGEYAHRISDVWRTRRIRGRR